MVDGDIKDNGNFVISEEDESVWVFFFFLIKVKYITKVKNGYIVR